MGSSPGGAGFHQLEAHQPAGVATRSLAVPDRDLPSDEGTPLKNRLYRWMGCNIGRNVEIMQMAWLDHFRPELISIGDNTLIGAFTHITVHGYEGSGRFRYGLVEIGANCTIGAGTGIGPIRIEDNVRTLPGTTVSPYLARIRAGSVVGFSPPAVQAPARDLPQEQGES